MSTWHLKYVGYDFGYDKHQLLDAEGKIVTVFCRGRPNGISRFESFDSAANPYLGFDESVYGMRALKQWIVDHYKECSRVDTMQLAPVVRPTKDSTIQPTFEIVGDVYGNGRFREGEGIRDAAGEHFPTGLPDCVVRAYSIFLNRPYKKVRQDFIELNAADASVPPRRKNPDKGGNSSTCLQYAKDNNLYRYVVDWDSRKFSVKTLAKALPTFIGWTRSHLVAVVDRKIIDTWNSSNRKVKWLFTKEPLSQEILDRFGLVEWHK